MIEDHTPPSAAPPLTVDQRAAILNMLGGSDRGWIEQALEVLEMLDATDLWLALLEDSEISEEGLITPGPLVEDRLEVVHRVWVTVHGMSRMGQLDATKILNLSGEEAITDLRILYAAPQLHELDLSFGYRLTDLSPLCGLPDLHTLDLSYCEALTDLSPLAELRHLSTINLSYCESLADIQPLTGLKQLRRLVLRGCDHVAPAQIRNVQQAANAVHIIWPEDIPF